MSGKSSSNRTPRLLIHFLFIMRFKFCNNEDVPGWVLSEIAVLSKISSVRLKLITRQVINELTGGVIDIEKVCKLAPKESSFGPSDIRATLAAIHWIISSATRFDVDQSVLNNELQQLGLPKENSDGVSRPFRIHRERLNAQAAEDSLRLPRLWSLDWHVDAVIYDSCVGDLRGVASRSPVPLHHLRLGLSHNRAQAYPSFPAILASRSPLLQARPKQDSSNGGAVSALGLRPLPVLSNSAIISAADATATVITSEAAAQLECAAHLFFSAGHSQVVALLAELEAARCALASLIATMPPPGVKQ